ncbi:S8 family peptidase [Prolixibacteraceae bacterium Z1-6]|uniref:S8 family peptidase n=1 Tax=Draconibacterium aestuarii TaxID=2998507 RepID=A0A9X3F920_9BACT|nr:S8 family peptidase [Prolixibacteraceae bacterium Z1-6]
MKKFLLYFLSLFFLFVVTQSCEEIMEVETSRNEPELKSAQSSKQSYIVVLNDGELNQQLIKLKGYEKKQSAVKTKSIQILKRTGITDGEIGHVYGTALKGFSVKISPGQLKKLESDASVKYVEEDQIITLGLPDFGAKKPGNGGGKPSGGTTTPPAQSTPWGIARVNGGSITGSGTAWVIDTGIDLDHPDLNVDQAKCVSFLGGKEADNPDDQNGHGTHVAGTIAAIDNSEGVIGVSPGSTVVAVRVLDRRGSGTYSGVIAGIDYVGANGSNGDVANMSLGGGFSQALNDAVVAASANVKFAVAAGNESTNAGSKSPASANGPNIYTISAMSNGDNWAGFSNYGNPPVDYCAPGVSIKSTWKDGGYNTISGTSMATPHVAGILLLGSIKSGGTVNGDPDGNPDSIAVH